ncbi:MAG: hypothetical protein WC619_04340 [Patescibacteria group bacterium]
MTNARNDSIKVEVLFTTDLNKKLPVNVTVSPKATVSPKSGESVDFSDGFEAYTVTAENGKIRKYNVIVTKAKNTVANITSFKVAGQTKDEEIDPAAGTVKIEVLNSTDLASLAPEITVSDKATLDPVSGTKRSFSTPQTYKVTAEDGTTKDWTVMVTKAAANTKAEIEMFMFDGLVGNNAEITGDTAVAEAKPGTDLKNLIPDIIVSAGATFEPAKEIPQNFSKGPVIYKVTSEDGKISKKWKITVVVAKPSKTIKVSKVIMNDQEAVIDSVAHTIRLQVAADVLLNSIKFGGMYVDCQKMVPNIDEGDTLDFSDGAIKFTLVAQDTTVTEKWTIAVFHPMIEDLTKAVIGKGEGVEHALARQVILSPVFWGYVGSLSDPVALKKWKGVKADQIADSTGYIDRKIGKQIGVKRAGVLYALGKNDDGKITVTEYAEMPKDADAQPTDTKVAGAKFEGADTEHLQGEYEYIFPISTPSTCPPPSPCPSVNAYDAGDQQSGGGEEEINFPTTPVPVWPAEMPI